MGYYKAQAYAWIYNKLLLLFPNPEYKKQEIFVE